MSADLAGIIAVVFDEDGDISYRVFGDERVRLFIIDERTPGDRVYEWLSRDEPSGFRDLVPAGSVIGSSNDDRHMAIEARIRAFVDGRRHLSAVPHVAAPDAPSC